MSNVHPISDYLEGKTARVAVWGVPSSEIFFSSLRQHNEIKFFSLPIYFLLKYKVPVPPLPLYHFYQIDIFVLSTTVYSQFTLYTNIPHRKKHLIPNGPGIR